MRTSIQILLQNHENSGMGNVTTAAYLQWSRGTPGRRLRRLDCYALVYVLEGGGRYRDETGRRQDVRAGDLIVLQPDVPHAYGPARGQRWDEIYVLFEGEIFDLWHRHGLLYEQDPVVRLSPPSTWRARLERVWDQPAHEPLEAVCRLQAFLAATRQEQTRDRGAVPGWLAPARQALEENLTDPMDLDRLARGLGLSYESFRKRFRQQVGVSPGRYRRRKTMEEAARLLLEKDLPLKQVAEATGFCDEFYFSRQFKRRMGISPGAYRRRFARG